MKKRLVEIAEELQGSGKNRGPLSPWGSRHPSDTGGPRSFCHSVLAVFPNPVLAKPSGRECFLAGFSTKCCGRTLRIRGMAYCLRCFFRRRFSLVATLGGRVIFKESRVEGAR